MRAAVVRRLVGLEAVHPAGAGVIVDVDFLGTARAALIAIGDDDEGASLGGQAEGGEGGGHSGE